MSPTTVDKLTYRGVENFTKAEALKPGAILKFNEPLSTSYRATTARQFRKSASDENNVLFMVRVPKGTKAITSSVNPTEREVTLTSGTSWRVIKTHRKPVVNNRGVLENEKIVEVEVLP